MKTATKTMVVQIGYYGNRDYGMRAVWVREIDGRTLDLWEQYFYWRYEWDEELAALQARGVAVTMMEPMA